MTKMQDMEATHHSSLCSSLCRSTNWVSMQWVALARSSFVPFVLLKWSFTPPSPLFFPLYNTTSSPSVTGLVWALDVCLLATGWPPLCMCGSLLQLSNVLPLKTLCFTTAPTSHALMFLDSFMSGIFLRTIMPCDPQF